jgi:hypothetical protein
VPIGKRCVSFRYTNQQRGADYSHSPSIIPRTHASNRSPSGQNGWERDLDALYADHLHLEERCVDVAARRAVEAYRKRGMPVPPVIPGR